MIKLFVTALISSAFLNVGSAQAQPIITSESVETFLTNINDKLAYSKVSNYRDFFENDAIEGLTLKVDYTRDGVNTIYELSENNIDDIDQFAYIFSGFPEFEDRFVARDNRSAAGNFRLLTIVNSRSQPDKQVTAQTNCVYNIIEKDKNLRVSKYECTSKARTVDRR